MTTVNEKVKRIYIAGPMTGYKNYNWETFKYIASFIKKHTDYFPIDPSEVTDMYGGQDYFINNEEIRNKILKVEESLLQQCDEILLLKGWEKSKGAKHELMLAIENGLEVRLELEFLQKYSEFKNFDGYVKTDDEFKFPKPTMMLMSNDQANEVNYNDLSSINLSNYIEVSQIIKNISNISKSYMTNIIDKINDSILNIYSKF